MKLLSAVLVSALLVTGCARNMSSNVYTSSSDSGIVLEGTVISARAITIKDTDKLQDNALGGVAGAAVGGIGASNVGKGKGNTAAAVGGALAGAVLGAMIQDELSTSQGMEYIVRLDKTPESDEGNGDAVELNRTNTNKMKDKVRAGIKLKGTTSRTISVIQGNDIVYTPGQRVFVIYSDDRPRITAAN